ncbi:MAG: peptidylprolyl isomerase [Deltaproteobacteria bacterium]|nr:peptidylprolyl isomerase [Deltaproteobacteria bacterium]
MTRALEDKERLVLEARRRGLHRTDDVVRQISELEDRLAVQALLKEERAGLRAEDAELRAFYESKKAELAQPERVQLRRIFVATRGEPEPARQKAQALHARLLKGETFATVVKESDGPERVRGGEFGAVAANDDDRALATAAFALVPDKLSPVVATRGGFSILLCDRRLPARTPPFEEVRADIENRFQPTLERRAFEQLLKKLRAGGAP